RPHPRAGSASPARCPNKARDMGGSRRDTERHRMFTRGDRPDTGPGLASSSVHRQYPPNTAKKRAEVCVPPEVEDAVEAMTAVNNEFFYWMSIGLMMLIHAGFLAYEVGASRSKNVLATAMKNLLAFA